MSNHIPSTLKLPTKYNVFNLHYQRIQALILDKHTRKIQKLCNINRTDNQPILEQLSTDTFWVNLKAKSKRSHQVEDLHKTWLKLKPFAHLNTKQLINLYQDHVISLERCYQYLIAQHPEEEIKQQLKDNIKRLTRLKQHIFEGLRYRSQIYKIINAPRNVDDVLNSFCVKINNLKLLETPIELSKEYSSSLDDDRRLFIFDLLKINKFDENDLHNEILSPIPKRGHVSLRTKEEVKHELDKFNKYRNNTINALELKGVGEYFYAMTSRSKIKGIKTVWDHLYKNGKNWMKEWKKSPFSDQIFQLRFLLYIAVSFGGYYFLIQMLQPVALFIVSATTFSLISSFLFYTVALAPIWWLGLSVLSKGYRMIHDYITCWKKQEVLDTLIVLEDTEHFICEKLSQIIIDIPNFDIKELNKQVTKLEIDLENAKSRLDRYALGEKFVCKGKIQNEVKRAAEKIELLKKKLKKGLNLLASHMALRVGEDIELLDKAFDKNKMIPILPKKQLSGLRKFVHQVGDKKVKDLFDKNSNIIKKWIEKIKANRFSYPDPVTKSRFQQPWGGSKIRIDCLKGWQVILSSFSKDPIQKHAALELLELLKGKKTLTIDQLTDTIKNLELDKNENFVLEVIQEFLFKTFHGRTPQCAALLSESQKKQIDKWDDQHKKDISEAKTEINQIFSAGKLSISGLKTFLVRTSNKKLSQYFELLDGEDIYYYSSNSLTSLEERNNLIRRFFEEYDGSTSHAYRLINFIPKNDQANFVAEFASKRLSWFLANIKNGINFDKPFDEYDTALFHNSDLHKYESFDFTKFVLGSEYFKESWSKEMEGFLNACQKNGLDSGKLLSKYLERKETFKSYFVNLIKRRNVRSCEKEANPSFDVNNAAGRGIRV